MLRWMEAQPLRAATAAAAAARGWEGGREVSAAPDSPAAISLHPRANVTCSRGAAFQTPTADASLNSSNSGSRGGKRERENGGMFLFLGVGIQSLICGRSQPVKEWTNALCTELCPS